MRCLTTVILTIGILFLIGIGCSQKAPIDLSKWNNDPNAPAPTAVVGVQVREIQFDGDETLYDPATSAAIPEPLGDFTVSPPKINPVLYNNGNVLRFAINLATDATFASDTKIRVNLSATYLNNNQIISFSSSPAYKTVSAINYDRYDFTYECTSGALFGITATDLKMKWTFQYQLAGTTNWVTVQSTAGIDLQQDTDMKLYVTRNGSTSNDDTLWSNLAEWSCTWANGLIASDDKQIADVIMQKLNLSGLCYGSTGYQVHNIHELIIGGRALCGVWAEFYKQLCLVQNVDMKVRYYCLLEITDPAYGEKKWESIIITNKGINNNAVVFRTNTFRVVFRNYSVSNPQQCPDYWGDYSYNDDVDYNDCVSWYQFFAALHDGHAVCFLQYDGNNYLYDPSFQGGAIENTYSSIPLHDQITSGSENTDFRSKYYDNSIFAHKGYIMYWKSDGTLDLTDLDVKTILFKSDETLSLKWIDPEQLKLIQ